MSIGVPIKVLHEAEGHIITCETNTGEVYRGKLIEAEDNMNCQMSNITVTYRDGRVAQLENVYIRGSKIRFLILPDMLKNAPMFKRPGGKGSSGSAGRGKSAILRAQGVYAKSDPLVCRMDPLSYSSWGFGLAERFNVWNLLQREAEAEVLRTHEAEVRVRRLGSISRIRRVRHSRAEEGANQALGIVVVTRRR